MNNILDFVWKHKNETGFVINMRELLDNGIYPDEDYESLQVKVESLGTENVDFKIINDIVMLTSDFFRYMIMISDSDIGKKYYKYVDDFIKNNIDSFIKIK